MSKPSPGASSIPTTSMPVLEAIYGRRSIRDYDGRQPPRELIEEIIVDAVQAPNSINRQAWSFVVVEGRGRLAELSRKAKAHALAALPEAATPELRSHLEREAFDIFYNAPALVVVCATLPDAMVAQDCCLAAQTLMLSAFARGLGSCWIGFAEGWLNAPEGKRALGIADAHAPVAPIILGYPQSVPAPTGRHAPQIAWRNGEA